MGLSAQHTHLILRVALGGAVAAIATVYLTQEQAQAQAHPEQSVQEEAEEEAQEVQGLAAALAPAPVWWAAVNPLPTEAAVQAVEAVHGRPEAKEASPSAVPEAAVTPATQDDTYLRVARPEGRLINELQTPKVQELLAINRRIAQDEELVKDAWKLDWTSASWRHLVPRSLRDEWLYTVLCVPVPDNVGETLRRLLLVANLAGVPVPLEETAADGRLTFAWVRQFARVLRPAFEVTRVRLCSRIKNPELRRRAALRLPLYAGIQAQDIQIAENTLRMLLQNDPEYLAYISPSAVEFLTSGGLEAVLSTRPL